MKSTENKGRLVSNKLICFIIACTLFTDYKIGEIKIGEFVLLGTLLLYPFLFGKIQNSYVLIILFFGILTMLSMLQTSRIELFYPDGIPVLKKPYIYPLSKFIEIVLGLVFAAAVHEKLKNVSLPVLDEFVQRLTKYLLIIFYGLASVWLLVQMGFLASESSVVVQWDNLRLKGFFVEGGPFGLFMLTVLILNFCSGAEKFTPGFCFHALAIVVTTQSKAGFLFMFVFFSWYLINRHYRRYKVFIAGVSIIVLALGAWATYEYSSGYREAFENTEEKAKGPAKHDGAFAMGRIPAMTQIIPNIVKNNWAFGVGMFNYPFVRDNPVYRGYWEKAPAFGDLPGLGFLVEVLYGAGIAGLFFYLLLLYIIWKRKIHGRQSAVFFVLFMLLNMAGISLTFAYPWLLLALALLYSNAYKKEYETSY